MNKEVNIYRHLMVDLDSWKTNSNRKPLIIRGARQVGKTTLVKEFSKSYSQSIFLNLEKSKDRSFFESTDDIIQIKESLFLHYDIRPDIEGATLLFLDEIQESESAIKLLRYFYEEIPELHVIAAGSLFELAIKNFKSFPVGRVSFLYLHPLNFQEFLHALGKDLLLDELKSIPIKEAAHQSLLLIFKEYAIIGGMPEVVKIYSSTRSKLELKSIYESIWSTYKVDVEKYANNDTQRNVIHHLLQTAHLYLDQRIKFNNFGNSNYKSREIGQAFDRLHDSKIIQLIYPSLDIEPPAKPDRKKSPRMQFLDSGIVNYNRGIQSEMTRLEDLNSLFRGALIPHLITQELKSINSTNSENPMFWVRQKAQSSSEVDLIYTFQDKIIPIEVKSGSTGRLRSLHEFINRAPHNFAVRISDNKFKIEKLKTIGGKPFWLMNLPLYLGTKLPEYISYFINLDLEEV